MTSDSEPVFFGGHFKRRRELLGLSLADVNAHFPRGFQFTLLNFLEGIERARFNPPEEIMLDALAALDKADACKNTVGTSPATSRNLPPFEAWRRLAAWRLIR